MQKSRGHSLPFSSVFGHYQLLRKMTGSSAAESSVQLPAAENNATRAVRGSNIEIKLWCLIKPRGAADCNDKIETLLKLSTANNH